MKTTGVSLRRRLVAVLGFSVGLLCRDIEARWVYRWRRKDSRHLPILQVLVLTRCLGGGRDIVPGTMGD
jgi:hypothetical protein